MEHLLENLELLILENFKAERYMEQNEFLYYKNFNKEIREINRLELEKLNKENTSEEEKAIALESQKETEEFLENSKYYILPSKKLMDACDEIMLRLISLSYFELHPELYQGTIRNLWIHEIEDCYRKSNWDLLRKLELEVVMAISKLGIIEQPLNEDKIKQLVKFYKVKDYQYEPLYRLGDSVRSKEGIEAKRKELLDYIDSLK